MGVRNSVFLFSLFVETCCENRYNVIKVLLQLLNASRELLSFENSIHKEICGAFTKGKSKKRYQQIKFVNKIQEVKAVCYTEITDIKYGLLSKHLFERTQEHGICTWVIIFFPDITWNKKHLSKQAVSMIYIFGKDFL